MAAGSAAPERGGFDHLRELSDLRFASMATREDVAALRAEFHDTLLDFERRLAVGTGLATTLSPADRANFSPSPISRANSAGRAFAPAAIAVATRPVASKMRFMARSSIPIRIRSSPPITGFRIWLERTRTI